MLFKKHNTQQAGTPASEVSLEVVAMMPDVFYGGQNPMIYSASSSVKNIPNSPQVPKIQKIDRAITSKVSVPNSSIGVKPENATVLPPKRISKKVRFFGIFLFIITVIGAGFAVWFFFGRSPSIVSSGPAAAPAIVIPVSSETAAPVVSTSSVSNTEDVLEVSSEKKVSLPSFNFLPAVDIDSDTVSDVEEELYGTDSGTWDTDGDGYYDGQEVWNLYNPKGIAPIRIIDSGVVREYVYRNGGHSLYYPVEWSMGDVNSDEETLLFTAQNGDYVSVQRFDIQDKIFFAWLAEAAPEEKVSELRSFTNRFGVLGYLRSDSQVFYAVDEQEVFVFSYHSREGMGVYAKTFGLMLQSFRTPNLRNAVLPDQVLLPQANTSSSAGEFSEMTTTTEL